MSVYNAEDLGAAHARMATIFISIVTEEDGAERVPMAMIALKGSALISLPELVIIEDAVARAIGSIYRINALELAAYFRAFAQKAAQPAELATAR